MRLVRYRNLACSRQKVVSIKCPQVTSIGDGPITPRSATRSTCVETLLLALTVEDGERCGALPFLIWHFWSRSVGER